MVETPPAEIAKQHREACRLVASNLPCAPRVNHGEVPEEWKLKPTCPYISTPSPTPTSDSQDEVEVPMNNYPDWCISSRGQVDVSPIVKLISEGVNEPAPPPKNENDKPKNRTNKPAATKKIFGVTVNNSRATKKIPSNNLWNEQNASKNNVKITRPSHDRWGIKKIVLMFCDDFLHTIYTLPWYQEGNKTGNEMHSALQPILDCLGIQKSQLVRCLLAGLPPGVTIPVHHDTGEWVRYTHRVHVPIIVPDPSKVLFRCGPNEQSLERVDCSPGHVFELNNQAKHAVTNAGDLFRVHLILDYVNPSFFELRKGQNCPVRRVELSPGEVLTQTRRSIDRALEFGTKQYPQFLILGAQKAGTTSLYEYINQHPWVVKAKRRETHCLDWRWKEDAKSTDERREHCLAFYHAEAMKQYPSLITGDSTPSYLIDYYRVIPRLKECFDHNPKMMIMTRDPIKRAISHYVMVTSTDGTKEQLAARGSEWREKTLEEVFEQDVKDMKEDGLLPYWDLETRTVDMDVFEKFIDSREEDEAWERYVTNRIPLSTGSYAPLARGLYAIQCRQWLRSFPKENFLIMKLEDMSSESKGAQWVVNRSMEFLSLPRFEIPDAEKKNSRDYQDPLSEKDELRGWLERFFAPHNERFAKMMVNEMSYKEEDWANLWCN